MRRSSTSPSDTRTMCDPANRSRRTISRQNYESSSRRTGSRAGKPAWKEWTMIVRRLRIWLRVVLAMIAMLALLLTSSVAGAQGARPSLLDAGVGAAMYGRCQTDLLTGDMRRATVVLGVFAPDAVGRLVTDESELAAIATMCAQQVHQNRCSEKIVALAGDVLTSGRPGDKAMPPPVNPGSIVLGTAGVLGGLMFGDSPMRDAAL